MCTTKKKVAIVLTQDMQKAFRAAKEAQLVHPSTRAELAFMVDALSLSDRVGASLQQWSRPQAPWELLGF